MRHAKFLTLNSSRSIFPVRQASSSRKIATYRYYSLSILIQRLRKLQPAKERQFILGLNLFSCTIQKNNVSFVMIRLGKPFPFSNKLITSIKHYFRLFSSNRAPLYSLWKRISCKFHPCIIRVVRQNVFPCYLLAKQTQSIFFSLSIEKLSEYIYESVFARESSYSSIHSVQQLRGKCITFVKRIAYGILSTHLMLLCRATLIVPMISLQSLWTYLIIYNLISQMQAVGGQVIAVIAVPVIALTVLTFYYWSDFVEFLRNQFSTSVRIEENNEERQRRQHHNNDQVCSICLTEPKQHEVSSTCGHSFCADCILSLYRQNEEQIKCPLCRQDISLLFKLFESSDATTRVEIQLKQYNRLFDDNRPLIRRIIEFPYVLKRLWRHFYSVNFLIFFLRNLQIARWVFIIIVYILLPFDLIPEHIVGILGYIDDFLLILFVITFLMTVAALQYHRMHNH